MPRHALPPTIDDVRLCASRMAANAADAVGLVPQFAELVGALQPADALLRSRPHFERGALWSYPALFEFLDDTESPTIPLLAQTDLWVRGVVCTVITGFLRPTDTSDPLMNLAERWISTTYGSNARWAIELKWRLDGQQGFIARGTSEIYAPATLLTGDGEFVAPLDWVIEKDQTIDVSARSLVKQLIGDLTPQQPFPPLRAVYVVFWGEDLSGRVRTR